MMTKNDAIDLLGHACKDAYQYRAGRLTGEFTAQDVRDTIKITLEQLMDEEPTDADADAVLDY